LIRFLIFVFGKLWKAKLRPTIRPTNPRGPCCLACLLADLLSC
jgi:hypothetical protein